MKNIIKSLLTIVMVATLSLSYAQKSAAEKAADSSLKKWKTELNLTDDQAQKFYDSTLELQKVLKDANASDADKKAAYTKHNKNLKTILTPEQQAKKKEVDDAGKKK